MATSPKLSIGDTGGLPAIPPLCGIIAPYGQSLRDGGVNMRVLAAYEWLGVAGHWVGRGVWPRTVEAEVGLALHANHTTAVKCPSLVGGVAKEGWR